MAKAKAASKAVKTVPAPSAQVPAPKSAGPSPDMTLASPVAGAVKLTGVFMVESHSRRGVTVYTDQAAVDFSMTGGEAEVGHSSDLADFHVRLRFMLQVLTKGAETANDPLVEISGTFVLLYARPKHEGVTEANLLAFAKTSSVFSVWPYWREYIHSTSLRLSIPAIVLPTYRI